MIFLLYRRLFVGLRCAPLFFFSFFLSSAQAVSTVGWVEDRRSHFLNIFINISNQQDYKKIKKNTIEKKKGRKRAGARERGVLILRRVRESRTGRGTYVDVETKESSWSKSNNQQHHSLSDSVVCHRVLHEGGRK